MTVGRKGVLERHSSDLPRFTYVSSVDRSGASVIEFILICPAFSRLVSICRNNHSSISPSYSSIVYALFVLSWSIHLLVILHSFTSSSSSCLCDRCTTPFATASMIWRKMRPWCISVSIRNAPATLTAERYWMMCQSLNCILQSPHRQSGGFWFWPCFRFLFYDVSSLLLLMRRSCSAEVGSTSCTRDLHRFLCLVPAPRANREWMRSVS